MFLAAHYSSTRIVVKVQQRSQAALPKPQPRRPPPARLGASIELLKFADAVLSMAASIQSSIQADHINMMERIVAGFPHAKIAFVDLTFPENLAPFGGTCSI